MSHHGTTRKIANQLAQFLGKENTTMIDLDTDRVPDLNSFDTILIGGSIHAGQIQKKIREFCINNETILLTKRIGLFMCCMEPHEKMNEFTNAFPESLRKHAVATGLFGGELLLDKMNFLERIFIKSVYGIKKNVSEIDHKAIEAFKERLLLTP
jgi:menaquinone-dependent protoporphyrinogen oxidase